MDEVIDVKEKEFDRLDHLPGVSDRVKAAVTDTFVLVVIMFGIAQILPHFGEVTGETKKWVFIVCILLYDPLLTSFLGGTIGHFAFGIRVKRLKNMDKNILLPLAIIRYGIKILLGWISLLTISSSKNRMAIHDMIVNSVVVYK